MKSRKTSWQFFCSSIVVIVVVSVGRKMEIWIFSRNGVPLRVGCSCLMSHTVFLFHSLLHTLTYTFKNTHTPYLFHSGTHLYPISLMHSHTHTHTLLLTLPKEILVTRNTKKHFRRSLSICQCKTIAITITITKAITIGSKISQCDESLILLIVRRFVESGFEPFSKTKMLYWPYVNFEN